MVNGGDNVGAYRRMEGQRGMDGWASLQQHVGAYIHQIQAVDEHHTGDARDLWQSDLQHTKRECASGGTNDHRDAV